MTPPTPRQWTLAGIGAGVAAVLGIMSLLVNWALDTDTRIGNSENQRAAFVQADSALFARDSVQDLRLKNIERALGIKNRRGQTLPPPPPPPREGILKKVWHLFF